VKENFGELDEHCSETQVANMAEFMETMPLEEGRGSALYHGGL
jgi:hypothetical protein